MNQVNVKVKSIGNLTTQVNSFNKQEPQWFVEDQYTSIPAWHLLLTLVTKCFEVESHSSTSFCCKSASVVMLVQHAKLIPQEFKRLSSGPQAGHFIVSSP